MIKLRLWGKPEEVQSMENFIKSLEGLRVLNSSTPYRDRGESVYCRQYMEVELKDKDPSATNE